MVRCAGMERRAPAIRQRLTAAHVKADDRRAKFVTVAAYAEAGEGHNRPFPQRERKLSHRSGLDSGGGKYRQPQERRDGRPCRRIAHRHRLASRPAAGRIAARHTIPAPASTPGPGLAAGGGNRAGVARRGCLFIVAARAAYQGYISNRRLLHRNSRPALVVVLPEGQGSWRNRNYT